MKLLRLRVQSFAAVSSVDVEFGSGLNVLYGPNDLGKSTVTRVYPLCPVTSPLVNPLRAVHRLGRRR